MQTEEIVAELAGAWNAGGDRPIGPGTALVHTVSTLTVPSGPRAGTTEAVQTMVVRGGRVAAFHGTIRTGMAGFAGDDADLAALEPLGWAGDA